MRRTYYFDNLNGSVSLLELLQREGADIAADCGGKGTCGKCAIYLDGKQVKSCTVFPEGKIRVEVPERPEEMAIQGLNARRTKGDETAGTPVNPAICIDLGTTTIAGALFDVNSKYVISQKNAINSQRSYGADVISRIEACISGKTEELKAAVRSDIDRIIRELTAGTGLDAGEIPVYISGNTAMEHIFAGYDVKGLAEAPYEPATTDFIEADGYRLMPGFSAFVGGDILMGLLGMGVFDTEEVTAFIDIGTNGEMAVGNKEKIFVAGTAAGPALEGGNISCGSPAVSGAVSKVEIMGQLVDVKAIGDARPVSLCGSGIIEAVSEMLKNGIIDRHGNLNEDFGGRYSLCQNVEITQEDIRQVQLAKSAIRAGLEVLIERAGYEICDVRKLYIAGGFGKNLDIEKCCSIGLIDPEFSDKTELVGNTSLLGTVKYACGDITDDDITRIKAKTESVNLADSEEFQKKFIEYMSF